MSWVDENPTDGINTYYVLAANDKGNGVIDSIRCYMGIDVPGAVGNIMLEEETARVSISLGPLLRRVPTMATSALRSQLQDHPSAGQRGRGRERDRHEIYRQHARRAAELFLYRPGRQRQGCWCHRHLQSYHAGSALKTPVSLAFDTQTDADRWSTNKMNNSIYFYYAGGWSDDYKCMIGYGTSTGTVEAR